MLSSPFEQFQIQSYSLSYTLTDTILIAFNLFFLLQFIYLTLSFKISYVYFQSFFYSLFKGTYNFIYVTIYSYLVDRTKMFFPFFFYLFLFICLSNLVGIVPFSFTITSHLNITFSLSFLVWWATCLLGFYESGLAFIAIFYVKGIPFVLVPFLALIEVISFIFRSVSLALRLFANIVAGHILLDTVALFIYKLVNPLFFSIKFSLISILPIILCVVLILFELVVAILQGYIFVILSVIYLKDAYIAH
ncbi:ATP synthase F0 subunit 6 (mitochondrion) [Naegleria fowleri]|uniref:ATP synthase subunit a n=1 Tax=Naegleria fowleri TaxID=5763 RepID=M4H673_NAEFO|nr:ATP synthase F0 subunit 6 [Naegleria fowleri]AFP72328.1 ATP synthase F0 subunit 6 [Naegleria fowleri]AOS85624.1 Atp6 [Naegleria fowleri]AOS85670.1 Atp6 [Naegleria fowleri]UAT97096.1 ATP synthase F0 subunit 6 [Naegleria fowleri]WND64466.1 ATP synthase subunit a [Naegleria fowleri]